MPDDGLEIRYSDEQGMLADTASSMLAKKCTFERVRQWMDTPSGYSQELWTEMGELGWLGIAIPEEYGGSGLGVPELVSLMEPMGRQLLASPFLATTLAGNLLLTAGSEDQKKKWLPEIAAGRCITTMAVTEPLGSWEPEHTRCEAREQGDGYLLSGIKCSILDGKNADLIIGVFQMGGKPALFLIEPDRCGQLNQTRERLVDETRRSSRIAFDQFKVPRNALMREDGADFLNEVSRLAWVMLSAEMAGGAEGAFQLTLDYLKIRKQFGRLIGSFQALKHPMADIMMAIENTRSLAYHAATIYDGKGRQSEIAARMAKTFAIETYTYAVSRAVQFHGAIGFTWECNAQLFFRRAQWDKFSYGDALHHRRHLADLLFS